MKVSVIIVNFNVKYFLEQCLCSLLKACRNISAEIIVVDNKSTDGSREFFEGRFEAVHFVWCPVNAGFSKANNLALKKATGDYILFLNPDTILPEDCLEKCLQFMQGETELGALGIRMVDGSGNFLKESKRAFPSLFTSFCKLSGLTALFPRSKVFARYYLGHLDPYKNHEVDVLAGAFMFFRKTVLQKTGGFDERFFLYGEDVDLSYRVQTSGFKNFYFAESTIIHFKGESMKRGSLSYFRLFYGAMVLFVRKHYSGGLASFYNLLIQVAIWIKAVLAAMAHSVENLLVNKKEAPAGSRCFVIACKEEFDYISARFKKNKNGPVIVGRIDPGYPHGETAGENIEHLPALIEQQRVNELIICTNGLSVKEMIGLVQLLPGDLTFRFHVAGTRSIVGSRHEKYSGDCITIAG